MQHIMMGEKQDNSKKKTQNKQTKNIQLVTHTKYTSYPFLLDMVRYTKFLVYFMDY